MTTAEPPQAPLSPRIGTAERQQAMDALDVHLSAGRLDPEEYGERVGRASVARTVADLEPLFLDLPAPHAPGPTTERQPASSNQSAQLRSAPASTAPARRGKHHGREPLGGRAGEVAVAVSPFVALVLFFATVSYWDQAWLFFLLIPAIGAVVYGKDRHED